MANLSFEYFENEAKKRFRTLEPVLRIRIQHPDQGTSLSIIAGKIYSKQNIFSSGLDPDPALFFSGFKMPTKRKRQKL
jgi:hypothetical protein